MIDSSVWGLWVALVILNLVKGLVHGVCNVAAGTIPTDRAAVRSSLYALPFDLVITWVLAWVLVQILE